jgi:hypothetical protein
VPTEEEEYITVTINNNNNNDDANDNIINTEIQNYVGPALGLADVDPERTSSHSIHHNFHLTEEEVNNVSLLEHTGGGAAKKGQILFSYHGQH